MSRETLKSFLASNGYTTQQISYVVADKNGSGALDTGDDLGVDPGTGRDLLGLDSPARGLVGDYLKYITENLNKIYPNTSEHLVLNSNDVGINLLRESLKNDSW
jgi:hypothetical protein